MKTCQSCSAEIPAGKNYKRQKFCGKPCYWESIGKRAGAFATGYGFVTKFWSHVEKNGQDDCWPWLGTENGNGYGTIGGSPFATGKNRKDFAHRVSYAIANGHMPEGLVVRHTCDNRMCVNPRHLIIGTQSQNVDDAVERDRLMRGEAHRASKLTVADVIAIRESPLSLRALARQYGVSDSTIFRAKTKVTWRRDG